MWCVLEVVSLKLQAKPVTCMNMCIKQINYDMFSSNIAPPLD